VIVTADVAVPEPLVAQMPPLPRESTALGLVRTEYLFAGWSDWPTAADQRNAYASVFRRTGCQKARVRVFDVAVDKTPWAPEQHTPRGGVSYLLERPALLVQQLEMLIEAAEAHDVALQVATSYLVDPDDAERFAALASDTGLDEPAVMLETPATIALAERYCSGYTTALIGLGDLVPLMFGVERGGRMTPSVRSLVPEGIERLVPSAHRLRTGEPTTAICGAADAELASRVARTLQSAEVIIPYADLVRAGCTRRG
jgi:phosphoenolpyruvate-protein kinase (PTS system EI component)